MAAVISGCAVTEDPGMLNDYSSPFGENVMLFDDSMDMQSIQETLDTLHTQQAQDEFSRNRYALLFRPGEYELDVTVDYYVQAAGLGQVPGDVRIRGTVQSIATDKRGNVTTKFWRSAENMQVTPTAKDKLVYWAVSQAAPYRRMHVLGNLQFDKRRWASGGYLANSVVEGWAGLTTGQQWFTRNAELGEWRGGNWNRTFVGTLGAPTRPWPEKPNTVVAETPVIRDKPFLAMDRSGDFYVFRPALETASRGVSWRREENGKRIPLDEFHIATPERDTARSINAALANGRHLLLTPGIYELDAPISIERPDTLVMGMGLATLVPQTGNAALKTADVPGISISSLMVDAGPENSPVLVEIGPPDSVGDSRRNPISLHDLYCRVGGAAPGRADTCLSINSHHVIVDHTWLWRADHGAGVGWDDNTSQHGLIVNGDDVTVYGLFVEHFQGYQALWNGERGRVYFVQSEIPYDPPSQDRWMSGNTKGYAAYKVADGIRSHEVYGLGIYSFFAVREKRDPGVRLTSAIEAPDGKAVHVTHISIFAGGFGGIDHPVNGLGEATDAQALKFFDGLNPLP